MVVDLSIPFGNKFIVKPAEADVKTTSDQILFLLKTRGASQTVELAGRLAMSRQGARQHLENLAALGLVRHETQASGIGRPGRLWSLTAAGHAHFPDSHAQMTVDLIGAVRAEFGEEGLERLISRRERETTSAYVAAVDGASSLSDRLERLAALRSGEGYMAEWTRGEDGSYLFVENHCPVCAAAAACQGLCRAELATFRMVLGTGCSIERVEHILAGARRCAYRIVAAAPGPRDAS
ncbi:MAG TPA: metalloregulator ArsR/SmtB family transcription factor [Parvibaculum sp.]